MSSLRFGQSSSPSFRKKDPVLRFSNISEIKSIINQYETKDRAVALEKINSSRPASYYGQTADESSFSTRRIFPIDEMDSQHRRVSYGSQVSFQSDEELERIIYYGDDVRSSSSFAFGPLNTLMRLILNCFTCWIGVGSTGFALMCVVVSFFAPRIVSDLFIYPCCRLLFGTLYPAYASYKAVRTKNVKEYVKWMMYWIVFALFTCAETFTDVFFSWFPFYYEIKIILVFWLLSPATKGSSILYRKFVHPALCRREQEIDECISKAKEQGYHTVLNLGTKGVNYATNVIMQTAIKGGGGLVQQLRKSYSLSDLSASEDHSDGHSQQVIDEVGNAVAASDPRLVRRTVSVRGRSPRTSSSPRVDMFFPEVDINMGHNTRAGARDSVNLSHIRSSEDISSTFVPESLSEEDSLTRTSSVGGSTRTRSKVTRSTFTSIKRPGAAEDGEVIIEEIDDQQIPFAIDNISNNIVPSEYVSSEGTVCVKYLNDSIPLDQYLETIAETDNQVRLSESDILKLNYQKFLMWKKVFESYENQNKGNDETSVNEVNVKDTIETKIIEVKNKEEEHSLKDVPENKNLEDKSIITNITENEKKDEFLVPNVIENKDTEKEPIISNVTESKYEKAAQVTNEVIASNIPNDSVTVNVANIPLSVKNEINNSLDPIIETLNNSNVAINVMADETKGAETECMNITGSLLSLNSICESGYKNKKRRAPLPPTISPQVLEVSESNISQIVDENKSQISNESTTITVPMAKCIIDLRDEAAKHPETSNSLVLNNQKDKTKKSKPDSSISKFLHLPSKLAFWNKNEEVTAVPANDNVLRDPSISESNIPNSTTDITFISLSNDSYSDIENLDVRNILSLQKLSTSLDSINDTFEDASEVPLNDISMDITSNSNQSIKTTEDDFNAKNKSKTREDVIETKISDSPHITYIPLKAEMLILHTESKSTDV